jgi:antitoxin CcdA
MEAHKRAAHAQAPKVRRTWLAENREAIEAYNEHVRKHGVCSAGLRAF